MENSHQLNYFLIRVLNQDTDSSSAFFSLRAELVQLNFLIQNYQWHGDFNCTKSKTCGMDPFQSR